MRNLYTKIFLWFWLAMVLLLVTVTWSVRQVAELTREPAPRGEVRATVRAALAVGELETAIGARGAEGARAWLHERDPRGPVRAVQVVDEQGRDVLGREVAVAEGARTLSAGATGPGGEHFRIVAVLSPAASHDRPPRGAPGRRSAFRSLLRGPPSIQWTRLAVAIAVSGLVCYLLARYLTGPLTGLRGAARRIAAGDLATRVDARVSGRRDELGDLAREFDAMAERIEALVSSQQRLLGDVSHELRSPLARLRVAVELARGRAGGEAAAELDRIEREAERLDALVGQILALARLEQGPLERAAVDVPQMLEEVAADADFEARSLGRSVHLGDAAPLTLHAHGASLRSAVENVVRNAVHHTTPGTAVEISAGPAAAGCYRIAVRDHGPGVPGEQLDRLFAPFYRVEEARDRDSGGHGLGLAIAERAVRLHGGSIAARNADGGGLQVEIELPAPR